MRANAKQGWEERMVTVDRDKLLNQLKENRTKHAAEYKQAIIDYKDVAQQKLKERLAKAKAELQNGFDRMMAVVNGMSREDIEEHQGSLVLIQAAYVKLEVPEDHTRAYDVAIKMAEWETNKTIDLLQSQFQCFVLDDWDWKDDFTKLSNVYAVTKASY